MRPRQRLRDGGSGVARTAARVLAAVAGVLLVFAGTMLVLLAAGVSPDAVDAVSGYRTAFDALAGIGPADVGSTDRIVAAVVGVVVAVAAGLLAWRGVPRPHLARTDTELERSGTGVTVVLPRAVERVAESAALGHGAVTGARARFDDGAVALDVAVGTGDGLADLLRAVHDDASQQLGAHGLPASRVDVTITAYDRPKGRTLR